MKNKGFNFSFSKRLRTYISVAACMFSCCYATLLSASHFNGIDMLFSEQFYAKYIHLFEGKNVAVLTNNSAIDAAGIPSYQRLKRESQKSGSWKISHFFAPEHGFWGQKHAHFEVIDEKDEDGVTIYSLHGSTRRPSPSMLKNIDLILIDIQDLGARNYTYASTVFYVMEAAALKNIPIVLLDRPNPLGRAVDGPGVDDSVRSFLGYIDVPLCHGMSMGELANYFHKSYLKQGQLTVIPYQSEDNAYLKCDDWWVPTSPHIPTIGSARGFSLTTVIASLSWVNIGVGYTLPFQIIGAPWIDGHQLCEKLNQLNLPGLRFHRWSFTPFFGLYAHKHCEGARIIITDLQAIKPFITQVEIIHLLFQLYPQEYDVMLAKIDKVKWESLRKGTGIPHIQEILRNPKTMRQELLKQNAIAQERLKNLKEFYIYK